MNDIYKNQFDKLKGLSFVIFPNNPYNFTELKAEITKMKIQELAPQLRNEKTKLEQLITDAKNKVEANFTVIIDQLLELQQQIIKKEKNSDPLTQAKLEGQLTAYQNILQTKLTQEEIHAILDKQTNV